MNFLLFDIFKFASLPTSRWKRSPTAIGRRPPQGFPMGTRRAALNTATSTVIGESLDVSNMHTLLRALSRIACSSSCSFLGSRAVSGVGCAFRFLGFAASSGSGGSAGHCSRRSCSLALAWISWFLPPRRRGPAQRAEQLTALACHLEGQS